jgi:hypothetical protein
MTAAMPDKFTVMDRSDVDHEARMMTHIVEHMLKFLAYDYQGVFDLEEFIDGVSDATDCDIQSIWDDLRESTEAEVKERVEMEFDEHEIVTLKALIASGKL